MTLIFPDPIVQPIYSYDGRRWRWNALIPAWEEVVSVSAGGGVSDIGALTTTGYTPGRYLGVGDPGGVVEMAPKETRHDYVAPYDYFGVAPGLSLEDAAVWTLTRISTTVDGTATSEVVTSAKWSERLLPGTWGA